MRIRPRPTLLPALLAGALLLMPMVAAAQDDDRQVEQTERHELVKKRPVKVVQLYPQATRAEPSNQASSPAMAKNVNQLHALVASHQDDQAIALAQTMLADPKANAFDKSAAWQGIGYASFGKRDFAKAAQALQGAIDANGLPNNDHFQAMFNLAKAQVAANQPDAGLATIDRLARETAQDKPEYDSVRGYAYFEKKDYVHTVAALEKAQAGTGTPDANAQQMLFASYYALKQNDKAVALAQALHSAHPQDKDALMNLVAAYHAAGQRDKAKALLADARAQGLFTTSGDYRKLIQLYSTTPGAEGETVALINEGLQKGILQPGADVYAVLAQSYVALGQNAPAIEAYKKADALSSDGAAGLNLARMYNNAGQRAQARAAAQAAISKGLSAGDRQAAQRLIEANSGGGTPPRKKK